MKHVARERTLPARGFFILQFWIARSARVAWNPESPMSSFRVAVVAVVSLLAAPAAAQTVGQAAGPRQDAPVRIQTSVSFFAAGPTGDSEDAQKSRDGARRSIYDMAARECGLLRESLAKECRLESVSINIGRQFGSQQPEGYTVSGSMSFQITLK